MPCREDVPTATRSVPSAKSMAQRSRTVPSTAPPATKVVPAPSRAKAYRSVVPSLTVPLPGTGMQRSMQSIIGAPPAPGPRGREVEAVLGEVRRRSVGRHGRRERGVQRVRVGGPEAEHRRGAQARVVVRAGRRRRRSRRPARRRSWAASPRAWSHARPGGCARGPHAGPGPARAARSRGRAGSCAGRGVRRRHRRRRLAVGAVQARGRQLGVVVGGVQHLRGAGVADVQHDDPGARHCVVHEVTRAGTGPGRRSRPRSRGRRRGRRTPGARRRAGRRGCREESSRGSVPETSWTVSTSSSMRSRSVPATLTTSGSSTPASWTLVPDAVLDDPVVVGSVVGAGAPAALSERALPMRVEHHDRPRVPAVGTDLGDAALDVLREQVLARRGRSQARGREAEVGGGAGGDLGPGPPGCPPPPGW